MTGRLKSRNGSALLIVLGMLSFMVISAVAFSMFMRENRLPSSFLRQKLVANHLVKAALANAMNEIDTAISSNPYPGVSDDAGHRTITGKKTDELHNAWKHRVFTGTTTSSDTDDIDEYTVPTLTLEALAYLPPPLINTVRYMSRRTPTARWNQLKYDAGRYAYTAVNVSDYLDINRLHANVMRDSSPSNRVSLAYLFENEQHRGVASGVSPEKFDAFLTKIREDGDYNSRLVSLADYNFAIGSTLTGKSKYGDIGFKSPFLEYFSGRGDGDLYACVANDMDGVKRQQFVTDSWYPCAETNSSDVVYLSDDDDDAQPFRINDDLSLVHLVKTTGSKAYVKMQSHMDVATLGALYDYIDRDSVPISLACPTLERTPMLAGLTVVPTAANFKIGLKYHDTSYEGDLQKNIQPSTRRTWVLDTIGEGKLLCNAFGVYPFKRTFLDWNGADEPTSYPVQIMVKAFFSDVNFKFENTRLDSDWLKPVSKDEWKENDPVYALGDPQKAYMKIVKNGTATIQKTGENRVEDEDCEVTINFGEVKFDNTKITGLGVYGLKFEDEKPEEGSYDNTGIIGPNPEGSDKVKGQLYYYDASGARKSVLANGENGVDLKLNFAVYVRILDGNGNTVDLVPATIADDRLYNDRASMPSASADRVSGAGEPVLPITTDSVMLAANLGTFRACAKDNRDTPILAEDTVFNPLKIFCDDPRFNFAPEDWYSVPEGDSFSWAKWVENAKDRCDGQDGRQSDIFQFVSDRGYLQSMGELQFLPNLDDDGFYGKSGGNRFGTTYYGTSYGGAPFKSRTKASQTAHAAFAWRTHWAFGSEADWADGAEYSPYNWGIADARDGVVVSPYSTSDEMLMAGLANTPYDWSVSGLAADGLMDADDVKQFCFNDYSGSEAPLSWDQLKEIASKLRQAFSKGQGWDNDLLGKAATANDDWNRLWSDKNSFFDISLSSFDSPIHDVDRKFLYSFWKGCFGDRQQLFLIFVRAEPSSMGAGIGGRTPSQLGARAVALVWREPVASISSGGSSKGSGTTTVLPHRMRILFYHQFE